MVAAAASDVAVSGFVTDHVVVISIDGLRPDAIAEFGAETIQRMMREGSYTLSARTILPSRTLPSHTSMLTGTEPDVHGITWNGDLTLLTGEVDVPTIFGVAHAAGYETAAFFGKSKFHHLEVPGTLDHVESPAGWWGEWEAEHTVAEVREYLTNGVGLPNLMFVHIGEPDYAGHEFGWMSPSYGRAVREADAAVAEVLDAANAEFGKGEYTVILTADHGGHGKGHGTAGPLDVTIPWIAWGDGVVAGSAIVDQVRTVDTAATALWLLGLSGTGMGAPVLSGFQPAFSGQPIPHSTVTDLARLRG